MASPLQFPRPNRCGAGRPLAGCFSAALRYLVPQDHPPGDDGMTELLSLAVLCLTVAAPPAEGLEARLTPLAKAHKGKVAIAVKHLGTGETFYLHADEPMPTASLIKLPVMIE